MIHLLFHDSHATVVCLASVFSDVCYAIHLRSVWLCLPIDVFFVTVKKCIL
jgi:hypothetical protein